MDYLAICEQAVGTLGRRGVYRWIERDELISEGCLALSTRNPGTEALAVKVARDAMIDAIRRNEVRQRGRQYPNARDSRDGGDDEQGGSPSPEDALERLVYAGFIPRPDRDGDLWDQINALPERQREAVFLTYWGGLSDTEAAVRLGVSRQSVDALLKRAQKKLREDVAMGKTRTVNKVEGKIPENYSHPAKSKGMSMLLTLEQVARRLGVSDKTARKLAPQLPSVLIGKRYRYPEDGVTAFINAGISRTQQNAAGAEVSTRG